MVRRKNVAEVLGFERATDAVKYLDEDEKGVIINHTLGGNQEMLTINESGLYSLILKSRKPEAKAFKKWVTSEGIPSIRKTGAYMTTEVLESVLLDPKNMIRILQNLVEEKEKRQELETKIEILTHEIQVKDSGLPERTTERFQRTVTLIATAEAYTSFKKLLGHPDISFSL